MRVWHLNLRRARVQVDGIAVAVARLARAQEAAGLSVATFDGGPELADELRDLLADGAARPDLVHFHSAFRPAHATVARSLDRAGVPYVVSPHSGYAGESLARRRHLKRAYSSVVERRFVEKAAGASCLTPVEEADLRRFAPQFDRPCTVVPNPVDAAPVGWPAPPAGTAGRPQLVTLCRYDVRQKGLDRLAEIARRLPGADFSVYGEQDKNDERLTTRLRRAAPPNLRLLPPVFGPDKAEVLAGASLFVLTSRWEGLSMSLAEALGGGVPCAVSSEVAASLPFTEQRLGLILSGEPDGAARQVGAALANPAHLARWAAAGAAYAARHFQPEAVAERVIAGYRAALSAAPVGAAR